MRAAVDESQRDGYVATMSGAPPLRPPRSGSGSHSCNRQRIEVATKSSAR